MIFENEFETRPNVRCPTSKEMSSKVVGPIRREICGTYIEVEMLMLELEFLCRAVVAFRLSNYKLEGDSASACEISIVLMLRW